MPGVASGLFLLSQALHHGQHVRQRFATAGVGSEDGVGAALQDRESSLLDARGGRQLQIADRSQQRGRQAKLLKRGRESLLKLQQAALRR